MRAAAAAEREDAFFEEALEAELGKTARHRRAASLPGALPRSQGVIGLWRSATDAAALPEVPKASPDEEQLLFRANSLPPPSPFAKRRPINLMTPDRAASECLRGTESTASLRRHFRNILLHEKGHDI